MRAPEPDVAPRIGLPDLPVVDWLEEDDDDRRGLHWKFKALVAWAAGRSFVWVVDEISDVDRRGSPPTIQERHFSTRVDPRMGLTHVDSAAIGQWVATARPAKIV
jgi:hypothetical protein